MGKFDRGLRAVLAVAMIVLYSTGVITGTLGIVLLALAVVFFITSMVSVCPLYLPFGLSTIRKQIKK